MDNTKLANAVTKALGYTENGGAPDLSNLKAGKSGETKSIFQFEPGTWSQYTKQVLGSANVPMTNDAETYVVQQKVKKWLDDGKSVKQIASMWNAGEAEPNAYTGKFSDGESSTGKNKSGVDFNVPEYADKVQSYTDQFLGNQQPAQAQQAPAGNPTASQQNSQGSGALNSILTMMKSESQPAPQKSGGLVTMPSA